MATGIYLVTNDIYPDYTGIGFSNELENCSISNTYPNYPGPGKLHIKPFRNMSKKRFKHLYRILRTTAELEPDESITTSIWFKNSVEKVKNMICFYFASRDIDDSYVDDEIIEPSAEISDFISNIPSIFNLKESNEYSYDSFTENLTNDDKLALNNIINEFNTFQTTISKKLKINFTSKYIGFCNEHRILFSIGKKGIANNKRQFLVAVYSPKNNADELKTQCPQLIKNRDKIPPGELGFIYNNELNVDVQDILNKAYNLYLEINPDKNKMPNNSPMIIDANIPASLENKILELKGVTKNITNQYISFKYHRSLCSFSHLNDGFVFSVSKKHYNSVKRQIFVKNLENYRYKGLKQNYVRYRITNNNPDILNSIFDYIHAIYLKEDSNANSNGR